MGSAEGGDQGVLNNGFCPNWNANAANSEDCGRLPWIFNVQAAHYETYKTLRQMSGLREPSIIHFVSDGKPWKVLAMDYQRIPFSEENVQKLAGQRVAHVKWREAFFVGSKEKNIAPPSQSVLYETIQSSRRSSTVSPGGLYGEVILDDNEHEEVIVGMTRKAAKNNGKDSTKKGKKKRKKSIESSKVKKRTNRRKNMKSKK